MDAGKGGSGTAQLCGTGIHLLQERSQTTAHIPGDDAGSIVGAADQHGIQQIDAAHRLADAQAHGGAVGVLDVLELLGQVCGHGHGAVQVFAAFQQQQRRHHLGQAGHIGRLVCILFQKGLAGVCVEQIHGLGVTGRLDGHGVGRRSGQCRACGKHQRQEQRRRPAQAG